MALNPNIILGLQPVKFQTADPLDSAQRALTLQGLMGQQDLQGMQLRQAQQAEADDMATRDAFKAGGDQKAIIDRLMGAGQYKPAQALQKNMLDAEKARVGIDKDRIEISNKAAAAHRDQLANVNDPQQAAQWVMAGYQNPYLKEIFATAGTPEQAIARIPQDPTEFQDWKNRNALGATEYIKQNKRTIHMQDLGGTSRIVSTPGLGGAPQTLSETPKNDPNKAFGVGPDGKPVANQQFQDYEVRKAGAGAAKTVVNMADGQKGFDNELKLRGDFRSEPVYKAHQEMTSAHQQITQALKQNSPAGDLAGATKIMKLLDPGSVVRESELGMAMAASGLMDRLTNYAGMVMAGTKLTPTQRADFQKLGDALFNESVNQYNRKRNEYTGLATNYGLNPERVAGPEVRMPAAPATAATPEAVNAALKKYLPGAK